MQPVTAAPIVFSDAWFAQHQARLLWLLHAPVIGRWFRWVLCIRRHDVGYRARIVELWPHAYTVDNGDGTVTTDFRTHDKYAKRLYYAFRPLWLVLHAWDMVIANPLLPALNAGFDTLTAYPEPSPEIRACDGSIERSGVSETWSQIRSGAGTAAGTNFNARGGFRFAATTTLDLYSSMRNSAFGWDTTNLGSNATVTAATVSLYPQSVSDPTSLTPDADIYKFSPANPAALASADYSAITWTSQTGSPQPWATLSNLTQYTTFTLNATGLGNLNLTGVTTFAVGNASYQAANIAPTWTSGNVFTWIVYHADQTGTANDPKLDVTYTAPRFALITLLGTTP